MNKVFEAPRRYSLVERTPSASFEEERLYRKQRLAATFRLFSGYGFDQGSEIAILLSCRDQEIAIDSRSLRKPRMRGVDVIGCPPYRRDPRFQDSNRCVITVGGEPDAS